MGLRVKFSAARKIEICCAMTEGRERENECVSKKETERKTRRGRL